MLKRGAAITAALAAGALVGGTAAPAHAAKPSWAGKPMVERVPVVESGPPTFQCGDRTIRFTSGEVIFQTQELPGGRFLALVKLRGARATDGTTTYAARGGGSFRFTEERGKFHITVTFVARGGNVERVNSVLTFTSDGPPSEVNRGSCTVNEF